MSEEQPTIIEKAKAAKTWLDDLPTSKVLIVIALLGGGGKMTFDWLAEINGSADVIREIHAAESNIVAHIEGKKP